MITLIGSRCKASNCFSRGVLIRRFLLGIWKSQSLFGYCFIFYLKIVFVLELCWSLFLFIVILINTTGARMLYVQNVAGVVTLTTEPPPGNCCEYRPHFCTYVQHFVLLLSTGVMTGYKSVDVGAKSSHPDQFFLVKGAIEYFNLVVHRRGNTWSHSELSS